MATRPLYPAVGLSVPVPTADDSPCPTSGYQAEIPLSDYLQGEVDAGRLLTYDPLDAGTTPTRDDFAYAIYVTDLATRNGSYGGEVVSVVGYSEPGDGGEGDYWWDATSTATQDYGLVVGNLTTGRWKRIHDGVMNVRWFGATGLGVASDHAAINTALAALSATTPKLVFPGGTYLLTSSPSSFSASGVNVVIEGHGATIRFSSSSALVAFQPTAFGSLKISGLKLNTTKTNSTVFDKLISVGANVGHVDITSCWLDRVGIQINDAALNRTASAYDVRIHGNVFTGDGTGLVGLLDTSNLMDLRGIAGLVVADNVFDVDNFERIGKVSGACENVTITGNTIDSTSTIGKQVFDFYTDANRVVVANNVVKLGGSWTAFVEEKNGDNGSGVDSEPRDFLVTNNVVVADVGNVDFSAIAFYGAWGLTGEAAGVHNCLVANNEIKCVGSTRAHIVVRGMTDATVANNQVLVPTVTQYQYGLQVSNNETALVIGNMIDGSVLVDGAASQPGGTYYANQPKKFSLIGNTIQKYGSLGWILLFKTSAMDQCLIANNTAYEGSHSAPYAIQFDGDSTSVTIANLVITGNSCTKVGGTSYYGTYNTVSIAKHRHEGNSWPAPERLITVGDTSPTVGKYPLLRTQNSGATVVTAFDDTEQGDTWLVRLGDNNTTIDCTGTNLKTASGADLTPTSGQFLRCTNLDGTKIWVELIAS